MDTQGGGQGWSVTEKQGGVETSGPPRPTYVLVQPVGVLVGDSGTLLDVRVAQDLVGSLVGTGLDFGGLRLSGHGCSSFRRLCDPDQVDIVGRGRLARRRSQSTWIGYIIRSENGEE